MQKVAIIGAGQAGLILGTGLVDAGYRVTLFSDRAPEAILHGRPMGFPALFDQALQIERDLKLNFWDEPFPGCKKIENTLCDPDGHPAFALSYTLEHSWQAIDQRLKFFHWMREFVNRGGELVIQEMTLPQLDACAQTYDLVIVAAGKGMLSNLFERDAERSTHDKPARRVTGGIYTGLQPEEPLTFKLSVLPGIGEVFMLPFYSNNQPAYTLCFEAYPGGAMDQFASVKTGQDLLQLSIETIQQFTPWYYEAVKEMQLIDENAWLSGAITPTVRQPIAQLPSGAMVMGIGDTVILNDPIAGQGANNANKIAHLVTQRVIEHGDRKFDADWMQAVFDEFWLDSQYVNRLSDCLLAPQMHHQEILITAAHNPEVARDYFNGFIHPPSLFPWFFEPEAAKHYLAQKNAQATSNLGSTSGLAA
jgi:hypothetical protein